MKAFAVSHPDYNGLIYIHAETRSKARYEVWRKAKEYVPIHLVELEVKHEKRMDDKPINHDSLVRAGITPEGCNECRCELCETAREGNR